MWKPELKFETRKMTQYLPRRRSRNRAGHRWDSLTECMVELTRTEGETEEENEEEEEEGWRGAAKYRIHTPSIPGEGLRPSHTDQHCTALPNESVTTPSTVV